MELSTKLILMFLIFQDEPLTKEIDFSPKFCTNARVFIDSNFNLNDPTDLLNMSVSSMMIEKHCPKREALNDNKP